MQIFSKEFPFLDQYIYANLLAASRYLYDSLLGTGGQNMHLELFNRAVSLILRPKSTYNQLQTPRYRSGGWAGFFLLLKKKPCMLWFSKNLFYWFKYALGRLGFKKH